VDEARVSELESAIADVGALLVRAQKYRRGAGPEGATLEHAAFALGDAARRLHRRDTLDAAAATALLDEARALADGLRRLVASVHASADYRAAVAAHAAADGATLARLLPAIFAGLEPATPAGPLFAPVAWLRRGRFRPFAVLVADVANGLAAAGDDLSRGADRELPAVVLSGTAPDEPVALRFAAETIAGPLHRLADGDEHLVHVRTYALRRRCFARRFAPDEQLRVEIAPAEYARFRDAPAAALPRRGSRWRRSRPSGAQPGAERCDRTAQRHVGRELPLDRAEGVQDGGVVAAAELLADPRERHLGVVAAEVHRDLTR
jgi:hypothetical protein